MGSINVRSATIHDTATVAQFNIAMALETEDLALDQSTIQTGVRAGLSDSTKAAYFLAEVEGEVVGQIMITHEWSDWRNGDIWWIQSVYVEPKFRRRGVFREMYRFVRDQAIKNAAVGLRLYVDADNAAAQQTYTSMGMRVTNYKVMEEMFSSRAGHSKQ